MIWWIMYISYICLIYVREWMLNCGEVCVGFCVYVWENDLLLIWGRCWSENSVLSMWL